MDENGSVMYLTPAEFDPMEMQPQSEYSVSTSKNSNDSGANVFGSSNCFGLAYQDHNYGAPPPSATKSGRQRLNSSSFSQNGAAQFQGVTAFNQQSTKQAVLQQHHGSQVTVRGQLTSPPGSYLDDEPTNTVDFLSPPNFGSEPSDRSPPLFYQGSGFPGGQSFSRISTFRPDGDLELAPSLSGGSLFSDFLPRFGGGNAAATSRSASRPTLVPLAPATSAFDGESHSYCVPRNLNTSLLSGPPPRAPRVRRPRAPPAGAFPGPQQEGQQMYAASTPTAYGSNFNNATAKMYPNIVEQHLISPESLTTIQSSSMDRRPMGSDLVLSSVLSSPPPSFDVFPNNIELAPYQADVSRLGAWSGNSRPKMSSGGAGRPTSAFAAGDRTMHTVHRNLPPALRAAGFTDADVIPIELPDDPTASSSVEPIVGAVTTVDVVDSTTSPTIAVSATSTAKSPDALMTSVSIATRTASTDGAPGDTAADFVGAERDASPEALVLDRLFDKLGVDGSRSTKKAPAAKKSRSRAIGPKKATTRRVAGKASKATASAAEIVKSPTSPPAVIIDQHEQSNTDTDDEEVESDDKAMTAAVTRRQPSPSSMRVAERHVKRRPSLTLSEQSSEEDEEVEEEVEEIEEEEEESDESSSDDDKDEWAGKDYTTRCLCDMTHNDEFMIQCDKCEVWQHCDCMGLKKKSIPENYLCHFCQPRDLKLTRQQARKVQMKKKEQERQRKKEADKRRQERIRREKQRKAKILRAALAKKKLSDSKRKCAQILGPPRNAKRRAEVLRKSEVVEEFYAHFTKIEGNEYAPDVRKAIMNEEDTVGAGLLDQLPIGAPCLVMYVTKERRGLVANLTIPPDQPILEFRGKVCSTQHDFNGRDADGRVMPYVLFYRGLRRGDGAAHPLDDLCVDARFRGTDARFVRRSCQPNTQVKHVIKHNELHLLLISTELIESATEVTIPFDYDYRLCIYDVECACKILGNADCPVERSNAQNRQSRAAEAATLAQPPPANASLAQPPAAKIAKIEKAAKSHQRNKTISTSSANNENKAPSRAASNRKATKARPAAAAKTTPKRKPSSEISAKPKPAGLGFKVKLKLKPSNEANKLVEPIEVKTPTTPKKNRSVSKRSEVISRAPVRKAELPSPIKKPKDQKAVVGEEPPRYDAAKIAEQDLSEADAREEKKLRLLIDQITKMEEREKKRAEKRRDSNSENGAELKPSPKKSTNRSNRKRGASNAGKDNDVALTVSPEKAESEIPGLNASSSTALNPTQILPPTTVNEKIDAAYSKAVNIIAQRNVAKKRWLRQALSEEISKQNLYSDQQPIQFNPYIPQLEPVSSTAFESATPSSPTPQPAVFTATAHIFASGDSQAIDEVIRLGESAAAPSHDVDVSAAADNADRTESRAVTDEASPSSSLTNDDLTATLAETAQRAAVAEAKKKVRMSLDEYKKRKVDIPSSRTNAEQLTTDSPLYDESAAGMTPTDSTSKLQSFIPELKESDLIAQPVRLSYLPDPSTIGKSSTTLDDLRRRIYGSFKAGGMDHGLFDSTAQLHDSTDVVSAPESSRPRMSLMERLKMEFGLDDHT